MLECAPLALVGGRRKDAEWVRTSQNEKLIAVAILDEPDTSILDLVVCLLTPKTTKKEKILSLAYGHLWI